MRFTYLSFMVNALRSKHLKPIAKSHLSKESFVGSWFVNENDEQNMIHLKPHGMIYKSSETQSNYIGYWEVNEDQFYFNLRNHYKEKKYYGKVFNSTLHITGRVCEGLTSPYYTNNFTMTPAFEQFHNISFVNKTDTSTYLEQASVTGRWILENVHTNNIYLLELYPNNTWNRINMNYTSNKLSGKWNLFNETNEINTNCAIKQSGKNIWLNTNKENDQSYVSYDVIFLGKIVQMGRIRYVNNNEIERFFISSKINGSVVYGFDMEPEISESFYMKRWFHV